MSDEDMTYRRPIVLTGRLTLSLDNGLDLDLGQVSLQAGFIDINAKVVQ